MVKFDQTCILFSNRKKVIKMSNIKLIDKEIGRDNTMKKFEFVPEMSISFLGRKLFRIRALIDFTTKWGETIHAGDLGGYVEKEENLSHKGNAWVCGNAKVYGNAEVYGDALVCGNALVGERDHILTIGPIGSRNDMTTFFRDKDNEITVSCGCFLGKIDDFLQKVEETHGENKHGKSYRLAAELAKAQINLK